MMSDNEVLVLNDRELSTFSPSDAAIAKMAADYLPLKVEGIEDRKGLKAVHDARMVVKNARVAVEKTRKALKADALEYGRKVDAEAKRLTTMLNPIEEHLEAEEMAVEREKARIIREKAEAEQRQLDERMAALSRVGVMPSVALVRAWTDEQYAEQLATATRLHDEAIAKQAREEAEAKARAEAEAEERQKEAERLAAERAELERQQAALEATRKEQQAELRRQQAIAAEEQRRKQVAWEAEQAYQREVIRKQQEAVEAEQAKQREALRKQQEALDAERRKQEAEAVARKAKEDAERLAKESAERARIETEQRLAREKEEAEQKALAEEAKRKREEALRPDREKLAAYANALRAVEIPRLSAENRSYEVDATLIVAQAADRIHELLAEEEGNAHDDQ